MNEMTADEKLAPCPFCGGGAEIERVGDRNKSTIYACTQCSCRLETGEVAGHGEDWNRRPGLHLPEPGTPEWWARVDAALGRWWDHFDGPGIEVFRALSVEDNPIRNGLHLALLAAAGRTE